MTKRGEVFSWGWGRYRQCGHASLSDLQLLPQHVEALASIRARVALAGKVHSLIVAEEGALYSFGGGSSGQLGHGSVYDELLPKMVGALPHVRIATAAAGADQSLALAEDGTVFFGLQHTPFSLGGATPEKS